MSDFATKINIRHLSVGYDGREALVDVSFGVRAAAITVLLGGEGAGKTSLLRALNRLPLDRSVRVSGSVELRGQEIYAKDVDMASLRRRVGIVFSSPALFPVSIAKNVAYGLRASGVDDTEEIDRAIETALRTVGLWNKLRGDLGMSPMKLTREDQQRLCIARVLVLDPEVLLLDDPTRDFDERGRREFEDLLPVLRARVTLVLATRDVRQAAHCGDEIVFLSRGRLIEGGPADEIISQPCAVETAAYVAAYFS